MRQQRNFICKLLMVSIVILAILFFWISPITKVNKSKNRIERTITSLDLIFWNKDPVERNLAWDSELPFIVKNDMEYADKHDLQIQYTFENSIISISKTDEKWEAEVESLYNYWDNDFYDTMTNFSMYKTDENQIAVYGNDGMQNTWFSKYIIGNENYQSHTLVYDCNLPFDLHEESIGTINLDDYSMFQNEENGKKFIFYKDGQLISTSEFPYGEFKSSDKYSGFYITTDKELYKMYITRKDGKPGLKWVYIASEIDGYLKYGMRSYDDVSFLPIFIKGDNHYVIVPEDWNVFNNWSQCSEESNFDFDLVKLEDISFSSATFSYSSYKWEIVENFIFNSVEFYYTFKPEGYDDSVILPEEVYKKYTKTVNSVDEYWENLEELRRAYFNYYDHGGGY